MSKKFVKLNWAINLRQTLLGGQSFRWTEFDDLKFIGIFSNIVWKLYEKDGKLFYEILGELAYPNDCNGARIKACQPKKAIKGNLLYEESYYRELIKNYLRLDSNLEEDYTKWIESHKHFQQQASSDDAFVTQIDQDIVETIFSFICSQNNHITRITSLVEKLCINYGDKICTINNHDYYNFPSLENLIKHDGMENDLRVLGFGYRAKYIEKAAKEIINKGGVSWLNGLCKMKYSEAHEELMKLPGIGPKVADCICLMSMNFLEAVPVDTHIIQTAQHYIPEDLKKVKSMNMKLYRKIGDTFRSVYGPRAGIAQTVLFCKELSKFSDENDHVPVKKSRKK